MLRRTAAGVATMEHCTCRYRTEGTLSRDNHADFAVRPHLDGRHASLMCEITTVTYDDSDDGRRRTPSTFSRWHTRMLPAVHLPVISTLQAT